MKRNYVRRRKNNELFRQPTEEEEWERLDVKSARRKEVNDDEEGMKDED